MDDAEINRAVAEACGWTTYKLLGVGMLCWVDAAGKPHLLPDYCHDLNAMAGAEKRLSPLDHQKLCLFLHKAIMGTMDNFDVNGTCNLECISRVVKATARQRAEALLRVLGRWRD